MERKYIILAGEEVIEQGLKEVTWETLRISRDQELKNTDWWALKDLTMSQAKKDYRAFLRDMPQNYETANDAADAWAEYEKPE
jgi:hypothetical protein|tara:strand:+ start:577 stop:825 length:249 start_codon:yes stop_codon:yes gene_type:complete